MFIIFPVPSLENLCRAHDGFLPIVGGLGLSLFLLLLGLCYGGSVCVLSFLCAFV